MVIDRNVSKYIVFADDSLAHALSKISENKSGLVFVLGPDGRLEGILSDGDFRRWLLSQQEFNLSIPTRHAANSNFVSATFDTPSGEILPLFSDSIDIIPLVDRNKRLVAVASQQKKGIQIGSFELTHEGPAFLIAEIGNNHNGKLESAIKLIDEAAAAGANCAKFQMRNLNSLYDSNALCNYSNDLGAEYTLDLLSRFQLTNEDLFKAFDHCKARNIIPLCTPWDLESVAALERYGVDAYKIASADLTNHDLIEAICSFRKPIICSTGMSTESEIKECLSLLRKKGAAVVALHCNSTYPAPLKDINLNYMRRLAELGDGCFVGYSGHERGIAVPIAAVAIGAKVIEKHFTLDQSLEGSDHKISLLPSEFKEMVRCIRDIELALGSKNTRTLSQGEMMNREVLGKSLTAAKNVVIGEVITSDHIVVKSPGKGLPPYRKNDLVGLTARRNVPAGDCFFLSDIINTNISSRNYAFDRPFGIPVRYHDIGSMVNKSNFDLLEFHFSYKDLELDPNNFLHQEGYDLDFVVHCPELFSGDHVLDLCSEDRSYRRKSIDHLQRVVESAIELKTFFRRSVRPLVVVNVGGFSQNGFLSTGARLRMYEMVIDALRRIDLMGVEIIPQTMPPFPWHFGGQRFHNLFKDADDIVKFCLETGHRICLDVSHAKLASNHSGYSFFEYLNRVAPFAAHLHIADASGVDGEGLQIGLGEIDFSSLARQLEKICPSASFVPEVWQGHKNDGEGFWQALDRLEGFFNRGQTMVFP